MRDVGSTRSPFAATFVGAIMTSSPKTWRTVCSTIAEALDPLCAASEDSASAKACWLMARSKVMESLRRPFLPTLRATFVTLSPSTYSRTS